MPQALSDRFRLNRVLSRARRVIRSGLGRPIIQNGGMCEQDADATQVNHKRLLELAYRTLLLRDPEPDVLAERVSALGHGLSFAAMYAEIADSEEALQLRARRSANERKASQGHSGAPSAQDALLIKSIETAYMHFLGRRPAVQERNFWLAQIHDGMSVEGFIDTVSSSEEAAGRGAHDQIGPDLSDGQFMLLSSKLLFGRGLVPAEVVGWQRRLETSGETRPQLVTAILRDHVREASRVDVDPPGVHNPDLCNIMGTSRMLTRKEWVERERDLGITADQRTGVVPVGERQFSHTGNYSVSMIASLYKGGRFIEKFLENITSQTIFDRSELIIVEADSPENEWKTIEAYQKIYPNIVYKRVNYRLGIYDAWNVGVELSRGSYLTNTNLDDLRRHDSIALQAAYLDRHPEIDVVYQNFFYSFNADLDFDQVAACGFRSQLPILTPHNFLQFNSPHNAPMWRKGLHAGLGLFDTHYRSAGDYEFWARCMTAGKRFGKIDEPHVVYYQNPEGISTRPDTRGIREAHEILTRYGKALISPALLQSRRDFLAGVDAVPSPGKHDSRSYYDVIQNELLGLGAQRLPGEAGGKHGAQAA